MRTFAESSIPINEEHEDEGDQIAPGYTPAAR